MPSPVSPPRGQERAPVADDVVGPGAAPPPAGVAWTPTQRRRLFELRADPYAVLDGGGVLLAVNEGFAERAGLAAEQLVGRLLDELWSVEAEPGQPDTLPELLGRVRRE